MSNPNRRRRSVAAVRRRAVTEPLERRTLLTVVVAGADGLVLTPASDRAAALSGEAFTQYQIYQPAGQVLPYSSTPTGRTPQQVRKSYGVNNILFGAITGDGTGQTVAIVDAYDDPSFVDSTAPNFNQSDLHRFDQQFGLPDPPSFRKVNQTGGTSYPAYDSGWAGEIALDVEWVHAIAPKASILLVEATNNSSSNLLAAVKWAKAQPGVVAVSMSYGGGEASGDPTENAVYTTPAGHAGVTFLASTGDSGAPGGTPSFLPNVVAVGGTSLVQSDSTGTYSSESGWSDGGGGISVYEPKPVYQTYVTTPSTTRRTIPDVSMDADPATGVSVLNTSAGGIGSTATWYVVGGTSLSCPMWAGLIAIADQGRTLLGLGTLDGATQTLPRLYTLSASDFHDVTSGNNGFAAAAGYDLVTGRGTPVANWLVPDLAGGVTLAGTIFSDADASGTQDAGESGIGGVTVYLDLNGNGTKESGEPTATTAANGAYSFADLPGAAAYSVRVVAPAGYAGTTPASRPTGGSYGGTVTGNFGFQPLAVTAGANGPYTAAEGGQVTLSAAGSAGPITLYQWDTDYDGVTFHGVLTGSSVTFAAGTLDGPASRTVAVRVTGSAGNTSIATAVLTITNAKPTATFTGGTVAEGSASAAVTFTAANDASLADRTAGFMYSYDFDNDGTFDVVDSASPTATIPAALVADGPSTLTVRGRVADKDGGFSDYTATVTVTNAPPTATFAVDATVPQGSDATVTFSNPSDVAADLAAGLLYSFDFNNDGKFEITDAASPSATLPAAVLGDAPGVRTIRGRVKDQNGAFTNYTATVTVTNVAPTAVPVVTAGAEGSNLVVTLTTPFDPSATDMAAGFKYSFDFGDDGTFEVVDASTPSFARAIADQGTYTVLARIKDRNGGYTDYVTTAVVANVAPTSSLTSGGPVQEGSAGSVSFGAVTDPSPADATAGFKYSYDFDNDGTFEITDSADATAAVPAAFLADGPFVRTVRARVTDKDGGYTDYTATVNVLNVVPTIVTPAAANGHVVFRTGYTLSLAARDPGVDTVSSWTVNWGDGQASHASTQAAVFNHDYDAPGDYTVSITAGDDDGTVSLTRQVSVTSTPPTATFDGGSLTPDGSAFRFSMLYDDDLAISAPTLGNSDVQVTGPHGAPQSVRLVSTTPADDGRGTLATYEATGPVGDWGWQDDGTYTVSVASGEVVDLQGDILAPGEAGTFDVNLVAPDGPDLVTQFDGKVKTLTAGAKNRLTLKVYNRGTRNFPTTRVTTGLYLSTNPTWDPSDVLLANSTQTFGLLLNQPKSLTFSFAAPAVPSTGTYYLVARTDTGDTAPERDERNNAGASNGVALTAKVPDLAATFATRLKPSYKPGSLLAARVKLTDVGASDAAGPVGFRVVLSADSILDDGDLTVLTKTLPAKLKSKASAIFNLSTKIPANTAGLSWHLLVVATTAAAGDHNAANDTAASSLFKVS